MNPELSSLSGGWPYDFSICLAGRFDGQALSSTITPQDECTFLKYAPLLTPFSAKLLAYVLYRTDD